MRSSRDRCHCAAWLLRLVNARASRAVRVDRSAFKKASAAMTALTAAIIMPATHTPMAVVKSAANSDTTGQCRRRNLPRLINQGCLHVPMVPRMPAGIGPSLPDRWNTRLACAEAINAGSLRLQERSEHPSTCVYYLGRHHQPNNRAARRMRAVPLPYAELKAGIEGGVYPMSGHGLTSSGAFTRRTAMPRRGTRSVRDWRGTWRAWPNVAGTSSAVSSVWNLRGTRP